MSHKLHVGNKMVDLIKISAKIINTKQSRNFVLVDTDSIVKLIIQGGSNMTGTDLYVKKSHCAAAVRP